MIDASVRKRFFGRGIGRDRSIQKADRRIKKCHRWNFAPGEHEVAERIRFERIQRAEPLVDTLVVTANKDQSIERPKREGIGVNERCAGSGGKHDPTSLAWGRSGDDAIEDVCERFDSQHHSGAAAEWAVVRAFAGREGVDDRMHAYLDQAAFDRATDDRETDDRGEHLREERDDIDGQHSVVSFFDSLRRIAAGRPPTRTPYDEGVIALERGRLADALACFTTALHAAAGDEECAAALNKRGVTHIRRGERDDALADFIAALDLDPRYVPTITNVGNLLLEDGDFEEAIEHYQAALRLDDEYFVAHLNLAVAYRKTGKRAESVRHLRRANRLEGRKKRKA